MEFPTRKEILKQAPWKLKQRFVAHSRGKRNLFGRVDVLLDKKKTLSSNI